MTTTTIAAHTQSQSFSDWFSEHWMTLFAGIYGVWVLVPWLAPIFMHFGLDGFGRVIYFIYSFFCHQLPERSFFLFGGQPMYSLSAIQAAWKNTFDPAILRQFVGDTTMGWKLAWSDRMVSFYTTIWLFALLWWPFRRKVKPLPWWGFVLFLLPIALDGGSHFISDLAGLEQGFRENNVWLAVLTNHAFPASFYVGNALGSFNSWMRLITGPLASIGIDWFIFPFLYKAQSLNQQIGKYDYAKVIQQLETKKPGPGGS